MPGIAGIIGIGSQDKNRAAVDAMINCMLHEPFYASGTFVGDSLGLTAGWVCHQGSFSDCMPVWNEKRDICLVLSGENYADPADLVDLRTRGHSFDEENASYLVHLYEELGIKCLEKFNGWFSGIVLDLREQKMMLFNDRYGLSRIYWHENEHGLYFASEAKSLLKVLPELRQVDLTSLGELFSCGATLQNRTLFSGISLLPAGSVWTFSPGQRVHKQAYFEKESWERQAPLGEAEFSERLEETWTRVLPRYFRGRQPMALSLTGGVDSRMILSWAPPSPGSLPCYTFGGPNRDCMDVKIARKVAKACQQPHQVLPVNGSFLSEFPTLAERAVYLSDGSMDVTGAIDLYIQRKARQIAPVRITGTYGGEILRRLVAFKPARFHDGFLDPEFARLTQVAEATYAEELIGHRLSFTASKQTPWYMCSKFAVERSQLTLQMPYFDNDLVALSYQAPPTLAESNGPALRLIAHGNPALKALGTDRGLRTQSIPGIGTARHLFHQFAFKAEYAYDYGMPQWLARVDSVFARFHLERLFLGRHKFHHFRLSYRDHLSHYLKDILLDGRTRSRSYLEGARLEKMLAGHLGGYRNYTLEFHKLLTAELIQRQLIDWN